MTAHRPELGLSQRHKSSYRNGWGGVCLEIADGFSGIVPVRDPKNSAGPSVVFPWDTWSSFVTGIRSGNLSA
ncbi:DUF397 domain-containing protein [Streptomyces sp. NPDC003077]|uniref:DUF397 domain-containing protein n=1 Tax=Streptomyces sp. NPDC003077 TaxID=3154443 RepID=UPI0033A30049